MIESALAPSEPSDAVVLSVKDFKIRLADTDAGRNSASMLIDKMYSWRGYAGVQPVQASPNRITLTAYMKEELIGTVTLAIDSPIGLLADEIFQDQLDRHRGPGRKLCELTKLAIDAKVDSKFALASLFHICFIYACRLHDCTDVFIEVNPRHRAYYERVLGFTRLGELKTNPRVNAPAFLLWLDLEHVEQQILKHGGTSDQAGASRSLYPYFFSPREEAGITQRLINLN
ncbi:N-acyl amino acid synthase FeeM domain-containing protein [Noviherbaspirillum sp. ST9]|uniref:N-acyl amino acid synthase FeeM domain-containing protein n=1 Tax=Noviherbaspirillum sp. ST9 TaxID=3401606 RepID=UPI003B587137